MNFLHLLFSEDNVVLPTNILRNQVVILPKHNLPFIYGTEPFEIHPQKAIIFPDNSKAETFVANWKHYKGCDDYRELMQIGDYVFYVVNIHEVRDRYYADEIKMRYNYQTLNKQQRDNGF